MYLGGNRRWVTLPSAFDACHAGLFYARSKKLSKKFNVFVFFFTFSSSMSASYCWLLSLPIDVVTRVNCKRLHENTPSVNNVISLLFET